MKRRKDLKIHGLSNPVGILFSDELSLEKDSVYVSCKGGDIRIAEGSKAEMKALWDEDNYSLESEGWLGWAVAKEMLLLLTAFVCVMWRWPGIFTLIGFGIFLAADLKPVLSLLMIGQNYFRDKEDFRQMKRNHGAEHTVIDYVLRTSDERSWDVDEIKKYSYIAVNCGNVAAFERFLMGSFAAISVGGIPAWGLLNALLFFLAAEGLVFSGSLTGHPAFRYLQLPQVERPGERELELAGAGLRQLIEKKRLI